MLQLVTELPTMHSLWSLNLPLCWNSLFKNVQKLDRINLSGRKFTSRDNWRWKKTNQDFVHKLDDIAHKVHCYVHVLIVLPKPDPLNDVVLIVKHEQTGSKLVNHRSPCNMSSRLSLLTSRRPRQLPRKRRRYGLRQSYYEKTKKNPR
jgi:hypothetical protein